MWQASRVPGAYSVMDMGYLDYGGGAAPIPALAGTAGMERPTGTITTPGHRASSPTWSRTRHDQRTYGWIW